MEKTRKWAVIAHCDPHGSGNHWHGAKVVERDSGNTPVAWVVDGTEREDRESAREELWRLALKLHGSIDGLRYENDALIESLRQTLEGLPEEEVAGADLSWYRGEGIYICASTPVPMCLKGDDRWGYDAMWYTVERVEP